MAKLKFSLPQVNRIQSYFPDEVGKKDYSEQMKLTAAFFVSLLFSGFSAIEEISPFGISFFASVPFDFCFAGFFGSALGYFIALPWQKALRYCGGLALCCVLRLVIKKRLPFLEKKPLLALFASVSTLLSGAVYYAFKGFTLSFALLLAAEGVLAFCACLLFIKALLSPLFNAAVGDLKAKESVFLVCSLCLFVLCASGFTVKGISAGRIAGFAIVMFFGFYKGTSFGCVSGTCLGAFLSVAPGFGHLFSAVALGGLFCGMLSCYGQLICAFGFCLSAVTASLSGGIDRAFFITLTEVIISVAVFCLIPPSQMNRVQEFIKKRGLVKDEKVNAQVAASLRQASHNIYQVCEIINSVSARMKDESGGETREDLLSQMKISEMQQVLTDQFSGIGDFLKELACRVSSGRIIDPSRSTALRSALRDGGVYTDALSYFTDKEGAVTVEISLVDRPFDIDWKKTKKLIELITKRSFERPEVEVSDLKTTLTFYQRLPYRLQIGFSQKAAKDNAPCGDSVSAAARMDSRGFVLISDGMGTGARAAIDSTMTATVMKKLICSGFSFDSAMKIVNSALIARSNEEAIASIDGIEANLFTGEVIFYKAGASYSLVRKADRAVTLEKASLPLGILRNVGFTKSKFTAEAGDIILLLSDGVTQGDSGWIKDELLSWSTNNMEDLSMHILKLARLKADKALADDMTVVAVKLERNR